MVSLWSSVVLTWGTFFLSERGLKGCDVIYLVVFNHLLGSIHKSRPKANGFQIDCLSIWDVDNTFVWGWYLELASMV